MRRELGLLLVIPLAVAGCTNGSSQSASLPTAPTTATLVSTTSAAAVEDTASATTVPSTIARRATATTYARVDHQAVIAFVAAWRSGDVGAMRSVGEQEAVNSALRYEDPTGPTSCHAQPSGQYQCLVGVAGDARVYVLIGEPGAAEGRVWWVAEYVPGT